MIKDDFMHNIEQGDLHLDQQAATMKATLSNLINVFQAI